MHGTDDNRTNLAEVEPIFNNLIGKKKIRLFENTEHESHSRNFQKVEEGN